MRWYLAGDANKAVPGCLSFLSSKSAVVKMIGLLFGITVRNLWVTVMGIGCIAMILRTMGVEFVR